MLDASASVGQHTTAPLALSFSKPLSGNPDRLLTLTGGSFSSSYPSGAKYCHSSQYASAAYKVASSALPNSSHEFKYGLDWRTVFGISPASSPTIRKAAGHSLKSSLHYTWTVDSRDDQVFPASGQFFRLANEIAGGILCGDAGHLKQDLFASIHTALPKLPNVVFSLSGHAGHLTSTDDKKKPFILDRFKLGGPNSVRGFQLNSIGPKDQDDPLGGDLALEAGASLSFPIAPSLSHIMRGQIFANAGMLAMRGSQQASVAERAWSIVNEGKPHVSIGAGLLFRMGPSTRLELNVALPIRGSTDTGTSGIQIGLGVDFL